MWSAFIVSLNLQEVYMLFRLINSQLIQCLSGYERNKAKKLAAIKLCRHTHYTYID